MIWYNSGIEAARAGHESVEAVLTTFKPTRRSFHFHSKPISNRFESIRIGQPLWYQYTTNVSPSSRNPKGSRFELATLYCGIPKLAPRCSTRAETFVGTLVYIPQNWRGKEGGGVDLRTTTTTGILLRGSSGHPSGLTRRDPFTLSCSFFREGFGTSCWVARSQQ